MPFKNNIITIFTIIDSNDCVIMAISMLINMLIFVIWYIPNRIVLINDFKSLSKGFM
jgi:hypothetical protein